MSGVPVPHRQSMANSKRIHNTSLFMLRAPRTMGTAPHYNKAARPKNTKTPQKLQGNPRQRSVCMMKKCRWTKSTEGSQVGQLGPERQVEFVAVSRTPPPPLEAPSLLGHHAGLLGWAPELRVP